jgi:damage-control phosphatase, subfamily II, stand-alone protein
MAVLCKIAYPHRYKACTWELTDDPEGRDHWLNHFACHVDTTLEHVVGQYGPLAPDILEQFRKEYLSGLHERRADPEKFRPLTMLSLDRYREATLRRFGWCDPYEKVKRLEDDAAVRLFPQVIAELDAHAMPERIEALIRGVFAGNIFDMGCAATVQHYQKHGLDFFGTRRSLPRRPWLSDTFDLLAARFADGTSPYRQVLFFVDNAGADLVLGCVALARQLALWGSRVVLAANDLPSLNDVTLPELRRVLQELSERDSAIRRLLRQDRLAAVGTGNGEPLIDLTQISDECNQAAARSDFIILEGLGRAVETNYETQFSCDVLKLAMIKDELIAHRLGGRNFDVVCRFEPAD